MKNLNTIMTVGSFCGAKFVSITDLLSFLKEISNHPQVISDNGKVALSDLTDVLEKLKKRKG
jgi:hypothetical protein